jgi:hypothetical protein
MAGRQKVCQKGREEAFFWVSIENGPCERAFGAEWDFVNVELAFVQALRWSRIHDGFVRRCRAMPVVATGAFQADVVSVHVANKVHDVCVSVRFVAKRCGQHAE